MGYGEQDQASVHQTRVSRLHRNLTSVDTAREGFNITPITLLVVIISGLDA